MNYERIYNQLIERAKSDNRIKGNDVYYEKHHIIPKCLGGTNDKENLVLLTAREHFLCHWILARIHPNNKELAYAFWAMCNQKSKRSNHYVVSSKMYQEAKESFSRNGLSEETKEKLKKPKPAGFGEKISKAKKGTIASEAAKQNMRKPKSNKSNFFGPKSETHKQNMRKPKSMPSWRKGKRGTQNEDSILLMRTNQPNRKILCQYDLQTNELIQEWFSASDAVKIYGSGPVHCANGLQQTSKGYKWNYK